MKKLSGLEHNSVSLDGWTLVGVMIGCVLPFLHKSSMPEDAVIAVICNPSPANAQLFALPTVVYLRRWGILCRFEEINQYNTVEKCIYKIVPIPPSD